ncbi:MAG: hypothetical protein M3Y09_08095, partial [Actinomycetota bacterium]|nr:hypothetical protein [Actinomycetota bacterium]
MAELKASRTLVKSCPELWAECSDAASLARHLGAFGEIQITKLEPETAVAWEGEAVRGTVTLGPSGWGTRVVLTAEVPTPAVGVGEPAGDVAPAPEAGPVSAAEPEPVAAESARPGFFQRLFGGWRRSADPPPVSVPDPVAESPDVPPVRTRVR